MATPVAILGSGNIGTDLMMKVHSSDTLDVRALVGIDPDSEGLARAGSMDIPVTHGGIDDFLTMPEFADVRIIFDATSAKTHRRHNTVLSERGKRIIDLTPAAIGPYVIPVVNMEEHIAAPNLNMVSCGGQATVPIVAAVSCITPVHYAEIVASIASESAGSGTRANIDEFTQTTARALEIVGGAHRGKAIIVLNPAEPPIAMRDTVFCLTDLADTTAIARSVDVFVDRVQQYVPGYRLKQEVQFEPIAPDQSHALPESLPRGGLKVSVYLEVEGAAHYLPAYAGNLDIMTSAALATGERLAEHIGRKGVPA